MTIWSSAGQSLPPALTCLALTITSTTMAKRYYKPEAISPTANLKPMHLTSAISLNSRLSDGSYDALRPDTFDDWNLRSLEARDAQLKARIRLLRVVARALATICSIATLVPLIMTIVKFLQTKDIYYVVNDVERTAWASGSITWFDVLSKRTHVPG